MYKEILLPVDLESESSWSKALPNAVEVCRHTGANLHVLTVVPDFGMSIISQYFPDGYKQEAMEKVMEQLKSFIGEHVPEAVPTQPIVGEGRVYEVVLKMATEVEADLIVMASQRPELKTYLLGPHAARVVRHAECSVLIVRG